MIIETAAIVEERLDAIYYQSSVITGDVSNSRLVHSFKCLISMSFNVYLVV